MIDIINQNKQTSNYDELLKEITIINKSLIDSKQLISRLKNNERVSCIKINIKKEPPSQT